MASAASAVHHATRTSRPAGLRSVLVSLPAGPGARLIDRVASLPLVEHPHLALLRVAPRCSRLRPALADRARARLSAEVQRARELLQAGDVNAIFSTRPVISEIAEEARAMRAELIVIDDHPAAARVIEETQLPVLVTRGPGAQRYRRPLIALDLERGELQRTLQLVAFTLRLLGQPHPPLAFVYAYDAPFEGIAYPSLSAAAASAYRGIHRVRARWQLERLLARVTIELVPGGELRWTGWFHRGSPRSVIPRVAAEHGCDLLVLGARACGGLARALTESTAADVANAVACDALLVPVR